MSEIKYTGHPFVDVGVAVMEIWLDKKCEDFTEEDFEKIRQELARIYRLKSAKSILSTLFTTNGEWTQPGYKTDDIKIEKGLVLMNVYKNKPLENKKCVFCEKEAQFIADRSHVPMLVGRSYINYSQFGNIGLPICGHCLFFIQIMTLGTKRLGGRPLIWNTESKELLKLLTKIYFDENQQVFNSGIETVNYSCTKTRMIETLDNAYEIIEKYDRKFVSDCIAYHFSNSGQGPDFNIYNIPEKLLNFLLNVRFSEFNLIHHELTKLAWNVPKKTGKNQESDIDYKNIQNKYWEALCDVFQSENIKEESYRIVRKFYLIKNKDKMNLNSFGLAQMFLKEVSGMRKERLEIVKKFGDIIAEIGQKDTKWINNLYLRELKPSEFLGYLTKLSKSLKDSNYTVTLDDVLILLDITNEEDSTINYQESNLIQSLILIRVFEKISQNKEILEKIQDKEGEVE